MVFSPPGSAASCSHGDDGSAENRILESLDILAGIRQEGTAEFPFLHHVHDVPERNGGPVEIQFV